MKLNQCFFQVLLRSWKSYNDAFILCEVNDIGDQVASILNYDMEYKNLLMCSMRGRAGQVVGQGFSGKKTQLGVKMSKTVKKVGALNLKTLIESDKLLSCDYDIMSELTTFIQKSNSFEAEEGCHDDLAMCLVIYAWLVQTDYFKELTDQDVRKRLYEEQKNAIEQDMAPFGFMADGLGDESEVDMMGIDGFKQMNMEIVLICGNICLSVHLMLMHFLPSVNTPFNKYFSEILRLGEIKHGNSSIISWCTGNQRG